MTHHVSLANFNHFSKFRDALPRGMKILAREGVEDNIYTFSVSLTKGPVLETRVSRVEDSMAGYLILVNKKLCLVIVSNGCVDLFTLALSPS